MYRPSRNCSSILSTGASSCWGYHKPMLTGNVSTCFLVYFIPCTITKIISKCNISKSFSCSWFFVLSTAIFGDQFNADSFCLFDDFILIEFSTVYGKWPHNLSLVALRILSLKSMARLLGIKVNHKCMKPERNWPPQQANSGPYESTPHIP